MKRSILLTSFGSNLSYAFLQDFRKRRMEVHITDMNLRSRGALISDNFHVVPPASSPEYCDVLLKLCRSNDIAMVIPCSDEEAFAVMRRRNEFERAGVIAAVQEPALLAPFSSKSAMYELLAGEGVRVPAHAAVRTPLEAKRAMRELGFPAVPLLIKPNVARGGRGVKVLTRIPFDEKDNLPCIGKDGFLAMLDGTREYLLMEYLRGTIYDVDILRYADGGVFIGSRKRFTNITKLFSGNAFDFDKRIMAYSRRLCRAFPTDFLVDYDLMAADDGRIELLEINPRPSGSTISYLPFGVNLFHVLAESHLHGRHIPIDAAKLYGKSSYVFFTMIGGGK